MSDVRKMPRKELEETLESLGLDAKERAIYLALLPLGASTTSPIARATGLKPTTAQSVLGRLATQGLIDVTKRRSRSVFSAKDPMALRRIMERRVEEAMRIVPALQALRKDAPGEARVKVLFRERATEVFDEALRAKSKLVHELVSGRDIQVTLGERYHYTRRRLTAGVRLKSLRVEAREIKKYSAATHLRELREARFLPRELTFRASIMFWDDTVAFFSPKDEGLVVMVTSASLREAMRQIFDLLWSVSRKMETA